MDSCANENEADMTTQLVEEEAELIGLEELFALPDLYGELVSDLVEEDAEPTGLEELFALPDPYGELVTDLKNDIDALRIAAAPYKKLPAELLAEIFLFCTTSPVSLPPKTDEPLLMLLQVCSSWREMALQIPELWANISVSFTAEATVEWITDVAEQWISRSGAEYPLSITAQCTGPFATLVCENPALLSGSVALVVTNSYRMRHFDLAAPFEALQPVFELPRGAFPCLQTMALRPLLVLNDMATPQTWHWPSTSVTFEVAPVLREASYSPLPLYKLAELEAIAEDVMERVMTTTSEAGHQFFAPAVALPAAQLSVLNFPFTAWTADAWCALLNECPNLVHLEVAIQPSPDTDSPPISPQLTHMDCLEYLLVSALSGGGDELIDRLVTPRLTLFILMGTRFPPAAFISFRARSNFTLHTFVPIVTIPAEDVVHLFQHFSDLKTLSIIAISTDHFPTEFWEAFGRGEILPHLEVLLIRPTAAQAPVLVDMIASRWDNARLGVGSPFGVGFCDIRPAHLDAINDELQRLEMYKEGGRAVEILDIC
ncbi:hypothetical protein B0H11DRAFT_1208714 [Mycena galericulata]|nr:hypothetical protein B0H11DRAFT_1208714 [Mycena galericulata]